jgi:hypothetical protein
MPLPIMPSGKPYEYMNIFNNKEDAVNDIYTASKYFAKEPDSSDSLSLLEIIDRYQDTIITTAAQIVSGVKETYYEVPTSINDNMLLKLKSDGLCYGHGRTVRFSDKAKTALKKRYLSTENKFRRERVTKKVL